jgi:hypothetical protein
LIFLLFVLGELIFFWFWWAFWLFFNEFLRKIPFRKMIVLLYNHYLFWPKRGPALGNFKFLTFLAHLAERPYEVLPSFGVRPLSSVVCSLFTFESSPLKPVHRMNQSLLGSILFLIGWFLKLFLSEMAWSNELWKDMDNMEERQVE